MSRNRRYCWLTLALASSAGALEQPYQAISQTKLQQWQGEGFFTLNKDWFSNHDGSGFDANGQSLAAQLSEFSYSYLLFASQEIPLPRVRYRLRLWRYPAQSIQSPALSRIELSRFNLGPMLHKQLVLELGEAHVAPLQEFGEGPHISWRFDMINLYGAPHVVAASRRQFGDVQASTEDCLGYSCLTITLSPPKAMPDKPLDLPTWQAPYRQQHGVSEPWLLDTLYHTLALANLEPGDSPDKPLLEILLSTDVEGNDPVWHGLARQTQLGDDSLSERWRELWVWPGGEVALLGYDLCHPDRQSDCQPKAD